MKLKWQATVSAFALAIALASPPAAAGDAEAGRKIAEAHCTRCHVVGEINRKGGNPQAPSFFLIVKGLADWKERFETFYARRPHPAYVVIEGLGRLNPDLPLIAVPVELGPTAAEDLAAYAATLPRE